MSGRPQPRTATTSSSSSDGDSLVRLNYVERIRSCYQNDPEAFGYYEELVDYIEKGAKKTPNLNEDKPTVVKARLPLPLPSYPAPFPFDSTDWWAHTERPRLVFIDGFPSPDAVLQLAQRWNLRPEFFIGHLFNGQNNHRGFYSTPTLPSRQENIIRIPFSSLVKSLVEGPDLNSYLEKRSEVDEACRQYEKHLFAGNQYGVTRYREIHQHDTYYCSVEQITSFTVVVNKSSWVAIYLSDQGNRLLSDINLPWTEYHNGATSLKSGTAVGTVPLVPYNAPIASSRLKTQPSFPPTEPSSSSTTNNSGSSSNTNSGNGPSQLHPARNILVNDEMDMRLLSEDPFFLLASLFTTSALSFTQLLNYLSVSIAECRSTEIALLNVKLERLRHCVRIIYRVESALTENLHWIDQGGCSSWPRARLGTETAVRKEALQKRLLADHNALRQRCFTMRQDCESAMAFLVSYSQLLCGEKGIAQSGEINRLTKLASFFVPLAFVTSAFGMNVRELQKNFPSLWVFVVTAVVVSATTYSTMFWRTASDWSWKGWTKVGLKIKRDSHKRDVEA